MNSNQQLFHGIHTGNPKEVEEALKNGADPNCTARTSDSNNECCDSFPLYESVATALDDKHLKNPRHLLENTPVAVKEIVLTDMMKIIDLLLEHGADIKKIGLCSVITLGINDEEKQTKMIRYLISKNASIYDEAWGDSFLYEVLKKYGYKGLFESIVESGIDLEYTYESGAKLIHTLCEHFSGGNEWEDGIIRYLLDKNIDVNSRNSDGETPLIIQSKEKYVGTELIKMLIEKGADINLEDKSGHTALYHSIYSSQNSEIKDYLTSLGARE